MKPISAPRLKDVLDTVSDYRDEIEKLLSQMAPYGNTANYLLYEDKPYEDSDILEAGDVYFDFEEVLISRGLLHEGWRDIGGQRIGFKGLMPLCLAAADLPNLMAAKHITAEILDELVAGSHAWLTDIHVMYSWTNPKPTKSCRDCEELGYWISLEDGDIFSTINLVGYTSFEPEYFLHKHLGLKFTRWYERKFSF